MPKSKLGRWAGGLGLVFVVLLVGVFQPGGRPGLFRLEAGTPLANIVGTSMLLVGVAALVTGLVSRIRYKDRSIVVILAIVVGCIAVLAVVMELAEALLYA